MLSRLVPDRFILWLLAAVALASLLPVQGVAARILDWATLAGIFSLFFLHGVRLPREALLSGFTAWRLHLAILASTFLLFPDRNRTFDAVPRLAFAADHASRGWLLPLVAQRPRLTTIIDKGTILLAVHGAFSAAMVEGLWSRMLPRDVALLAFICLALLGLVLAGAYGIARLGRFSPADSRAILFCGSVKSLASGVAMARVLFPGPATGLIILPIMLFHTLQLIVCAWIAAHLGKREFSGGAAPLGKNAAPRPW